MRIRKVVKGTTEKPRLTVFRSNKEIYAQVIDDLQGIGKAAKELGIWFHVDGAYGLAALCAPSVRGLFDGVEQADSLSVDPHKWLFAPFDACALIYRNPEIARKVHLQKAAYLETLDDDDCEWNPSFGGTTPWSVSADVI